MTPKPPAALDCLWETIPTGPAPVDEMISRGRADSRRRRYAGFATAAAVVVCALVVTGGVVRARGDRANSVATPPPGTRYVGMGQVAVAVPSGWNDGAAPCNSPIRNTVYFPWPQGCGSSFHSVSSVAVSAAPRRGGLVGSPTRAGSIGGYQVVESPALCTGGTGPESCLQWFGVPDLHVFFLVRVPRDEAGALRQVEAIRSSLTLLPDGHTAVPFVTPGSPLPEWRSAVQDAGFVVRVRHHDCLPPGNCAPGVVSTIPAAGRVAASGSTVTIDVQD